MEKLQQERLVVAIGAQIASEDMLEMTIDYVKSRKAFGKPYLHSKIRSLKSLKWRQR